MRLLFSLLCLFFFQLSFAQNKLPLFLKGHWGIQGSNNEEHWDVLSAESMKGFGYKIDQAIPQVTEYLDIQLKKGKLVLIATVIGQNNGKPIEFIAEGESFDKQIKFVNHKHDFPQEITYSKSSDSTGNLIVKIAGQGKEHTQIMKPIQGSDEAQEIAYDEKLAEKLGSDEYGMKSYFYVVLKTGENKNQDKDSINTAFKGHMDNINRLVKEEKLIVAGPFGKNTDQYRGLFILNNVKSEEEAKAILETDPAIKAGYLTYSLYTWYGSAALPMYLPYSEKITKSKF